MKRFIPIILSLVIVFLCVEANAQDLTELTGSQGPGILQTLMDHIILVLAVGILILGFGAIANLNYKLIELQKIQSLKELGIEPETVREELRTDRQSLWARIYDWMWSIVPEGKEQTIDLGHDYDGIRELDNRLPPWWLGIMYGTIIWGFFYLIHYHWSGSGWSSDGEYQAEMALAEAQKTAFLSKSADNVDENTVVLLTDEESLAKGKDIFISQCAACHGTLGEGLVGPNFTDKYWIHGGSINDLFNVIKYGVPEKGMISWRSQLRPSAMQQVASYILSLQGTNPPNQKAAEGELYEAPAGE